MIFVGGIFNGAQIHSFSGRMVETITSSLELLNSFHNKAAFESAAKYVLIVVYDHLNFSFHSCRGGILYYSSQ